MFTLRSMHFFVHVCAVNDRYETYRRKSRDGKEKKPLYVVRNNCLFSCYVLLIHLMFIIYLRFFLYSGYYHFNILNYSLNFFLKHEKKNNNIKSKIQFLRYRLIVDICIFWCNALNESYNFYCIDSVIKRACNKIFFWR